MGSKTNPDKKKFLLHLARPDLQTKLELEKPQNKGVVRESAAFSSRPRYYFFFHCSPPKFFFGTDESTQWVKKQLKLKDCLLHNKLIRVE